MPAYLTVTFEYASVEDVANDGLPGDNALGYIREPVRSVPPVVLGGSLVWRQTGDAEAESVLVRFASAPLVTIKARWIWCDSEWSIFAITSGVAGVMRAPQGLAAGVARSGTVPPAVLDAAGSWAIQLLGTP